MAAQEQERERVVLLGDRARLGHVEHGLGSSRRRRALSLRHPSTSRAGGHGDQPGRGLVGHALLGPLHRRGEQRLLHGVLGWRRTARTGAPACRGPAARARAAGPRRGARRPTTRRVVVTPRPRRRGAGPRCRSCVIWSIACRALADRSGSGSPSSSPSAVGMICQDRPYRSLSHPHGPSSPPSESADQSASTSSCVSQLTRNDTASVNEWCGPAVQGGERLPLEPERHGHRRARLARTALAVARDLEDLRSRRRSRASR